MPDSPGTAFISPFKRPWLKDSSVAAPAGGGNLGLRGVFVGGVTGGIEICITYPTEYVKTQLQLDEKGERKKYQGIIDCVKVTVRERGILGLYRGLSILIVGSIPKSAVRFGSYETYKGFMMGPDRKFGPTQSLICGLGAGISEAILAVTPMETIKVKFINDQRSAQPQYRGLVHGLGVIVKTQGVSGLYKGVIATIIKQGTNQATRFWVMETCKMHYRGGDPNKSIPKPWIALFGALAGLASVYVNNPIDVVKTRMQGLEAHKYKNTLHCLISVGRNEGPLAYYKGSIPRLSRVVFDVAITFTIYETIMDILNVIWPK
ncbi:unnamed protein product [Psylliodes chrysocephalus]|uniref:Citrate transport protein n=1 Tax=Psylliodes chrysocephalus TaxID=3402493 RepID=A0A9P0D6R7_9CUCU|nr:unnamed protein product [Psylliodes chrysocephala]